jgi:hypothetical protein
MSRNEVLADINRVNKFAFLKRFNTTVFGPTIADSTTISCLWHFPLIKHLKSILTLKSDIKYCISMRGKAHLSPPPLFYDIEIYVHFKTCKSKIVMLSVYITKVCMDIKGLVGNIPGPVWAQPSEGSYAARWGFGLGYQWWWHGGSYLAPSLGAFWHKNKSCSFCSKG